MDLSSFMDNLTLGMVRYLEKLPCIKKVVVVEKPHVQESAFATWEQKNNCILPQDLKNFFAATDGVQIKWSWKMKDDIVPGGVTEIVRLNQLKNIGPKKQIPNSDLPSLIDVESDPDENIPEKAIKPRFKDKCKVFVLDKCQGVGKVCLVFPAKKDSSADGSNYPPSVWFLDRAFEFHYLTTDFTAYFRLSLAHLGIPQWQYLFTPAGPPPKTKLHSFPMSCIDDEIIKPVHKLFSTKSVFQWG